MLAELDVLDAELTRLSLTTTAPEPI